jgi:asparagine synthetase B (glutamine-hydrolysing)
VAKRPLRLLARKYLPVTLAERSKQGLHNPMFDHKYANIILPIWEALKGDLPIEFKALFAPGIIESAQSRALESELWQPRQLLWRLIILASWMKEFIN